MADARNVGGHFLTVGEAHARDLTQGRIRFLRGNRLHLSAHATPKRIATNLEGPQGQVGMTGFRTRLRDAQGRSLDLLLDLRASGTDELTDCRHELSKLRAPQAGDAHKFRPTAVGRNLRSIAVP